MAHEMYTQSTRSSQQQSLQIPNDSPDKRHSHVVFTTVGLASFSENKQQNTRGEKIKYRNSSLNFPRNFNDEINSEKTEQKYELLILLLYDSQTN